MCPVRRAASYDEAMGDDQELVHYEVADRVAMITLDSQHNRNALSRQLVTELFAHLETAASDDGVVVVLIQAAGRVFCSGADLSEASAAGMEEATRRIVDLQRLIVAMDKPVVTRVAGAVRAGGIGIVAASEPTLEWQETAAKLETCKRALACGGLAASRGDGS